MCRHRDRFTCFTCSSGRCGAASGTGARREHRTSTARTKIPTPPENMPRVHRRRHRDWRELRGDSCHDKRPLATCRRALPIRWHRRHHHHHHRHCCRCRCRYHCRCHCYHLRHQITCRSHEASRWPSHFSRRRPLMHSHRGRKIAPGHHQWPRERPRAVASRRRPSRAVADRRGPSQTVAGRRRQQRPPRDLVPHPSVHLARSRPYASLLHHAYLATT